MGAYQDFNDAGHALDPVKPFLLLGVVLLFIIARTILPLLEMANASSQLARRQTQMRVPTEERISLVASANAPPTAA